MDHSPRTGGLQKKFFIALLIAGIVPGIVALVATYLFSTDSLKHTIGSSFQEIARSTAIRISSAVDMEIDRAVQLAAAPLLTRQNIEASNRRYDGKSDSEIEALVNADQGQRERSRVDAGGLSQSETITYLQEWANKERHYVRVIVADKHGVLVASNDPQAPAYHAHEIWWQEAMDNPLGTAYVGSLRFDPALNDYVFPLSVPVPGRDRDEPIGAVGLLIRRDVLMDTILPIRVGHTGHGMLLDTAGTPLVCPVLPPTEHLIQQVLIDQLAQDRPSWLVVDDDAHGGHDSIIGVAPVKFSHRLSPLSLGGEKWFAFVRQQPEETYAPLYSLLLTVGLVGFGLVVVLASLGFVMGRKIVSPILSLQHQADRLRRDMIAMSSSGAQSVERLGTAVDIRTGDEIEDLGTTFNEMRRTLEDSLYTIRRQHDELVRKEKLASVGQLLAALAHDLRNPLAVIRSSAQLVLEEDQPEEIKREVTRYIIDEVDKLTHRINDFLRYARQKPPEPKSIAPAALIHSALWQWKAQGGHERITVSVTVDPDMPALYLDPEQVKEALVNLLVNAREAMPGGGTLTVSARRADDDRIAISVADTGCGMSSAHLKRIFEPFFTTKDYGTGLGLTNVKRLVEHNGGSIEVESEQGKGSRFTIRFPAAAHGVGAGRPLELDQQAR